jgi:hypothetical protein
VLIYLLLQDGRAFGNQEQILVFRRSIIRNSIFLPDLDALSFYVEETGFEINGLHKAVTPTNYLSR